MSGSAAARSRANPAPAAVRTPTRTTASRTAARTAAPHAVVRGRSATPATRTATAQTTGAGGAVRSIAARSTAATTSAARTATPRTTTPRTTAAGTAGARSTAARATTARTAPRPGARTAPPVTGGRPDLRLLTPVVPAVAARARRLRTALRPGSRRAPFVLLLVVLLVGTTLGLLVLNTAIAVDSLKANQLRAQNAERAQDVERLEQQVIAAGAPVQLASAAVAAGLVPAGPAAYLVLESDGTSTLRGTPKPAEAPAEPGGN